MRILSAVSPIVILVALALYSSPAAAYTGGPALVEILGWGREFLIGSIS